MDREKLVDACDAAFLENYSPSATESPDPRWNMFADGFKQSTDWLMQQPLSERLTDEEKEKIRDIMKHPQRHTELIKGTLNFQAIGIQKVLTEIFGSDLFREK